jgi:DnaJ-class molecular chaperone
MKKKEMVCGFCEGIGEDPFNLLSEYSVCQVCNGRGKLLITEPVVKCVFCKGSGVYPGTRLTCTVCSGKGSLTGETGPVEICSACKGSSAAEDSGLPCLKCKGRGFVPSKKTEGLI